MTSDVIGVPLEFREHLDESWSHLKRSKKLHRWSGLVEEEESEEVGGRWEEQTNPSLDNCCLKYLITGGYKAPRLWMFVPPVWND